MPTDIILKIVQHTETGEERYVVEPIVQITNVTKKFGPVTAVDNLNLDINEGEFLTLLGPSGCGKTTTLRMIAGLEFPTTGKIFINGVDATNTLPSKRNTSIMFQNYALFPHKTVGENISFGLKMQGKSKKECRKKAEELLEFIQLPGIIDRKPHQLSGGQCQRVALARSLAIEPKIILLDEPLGALDAGLRKSMQFELKQIQIRTGITFVSVTHDQEEAMTMSDRIVVMKDGVIKQLATPAQLYEHPNSPFVARFLGECNFIPVKIESLGPRATVRDTGGQTFTCDTVSDTVGDSRRGLLAVRPESFSPRQEHENYICGQIKQKAYVGSRVDYIIHINDQDIQWQTDGKAEYAVGATITLGFTAGDCILFPEGKE